MKQANIGDVDVPKASLLQPETKIDVVERNGKAFVEAADLVECALLQDEHSRRQG